MPYSIASNAIVASLGRILTAVLGLLATALIARYLGPAQYGAYILLLSFGAIVQLAADAGLYLTLTREIAASPREEGALVSHAVALRLVLLFFFFAAGAVVASFLPSLRPYVGIFFIIALGLSFQSISQLFMGVYQRHGEVWRATLGDLSGRVAQIALILAAGAAIASVRGMALAFTLSAAAAFFIHQRLLPAAARWRLRISFSAWKRLLSLSWPLGLMLLLNAVYFRLDAILLSLFRSSAEVGWYGVAYRLIESGLFFPAMFGGLLLPVLSAALASGRLDRVRQYVLEGFNVLLLGAALLVVMLGFYSPGLISLIAGARYAAAAPLLPVLGLALAIMFLGNLFGFVLVALRRQLFLVALYAGLIVFNVTLNLLFIPRFGALAAAWTTVATEALSTLIAGFVVYRAIRFRLDFGFLWRLLLITAACAAAARFFSFLPWPAALLLVAAIFVFLNLIAGHLKTTRLELLLSPPPLG